MLVIRSCPEVPDQNSVQASSSTTNWEDYFSSFPLHKVKSYNLKDFHFVLFHGTYGD